MTEAACQVCMHHCKLQPEQWGMCRARKNEGGKIICKNYGQITSIALDPIEKKPLYMFYPGSRILSVGSFGCNLRCPFCQNHEISLDYDPLKAGAEEENAAGELFPSGVRGTEYIPPEELAALAQKYRSRGNIGVAFTYNEPLIGWEYILDTAKLLKEDKMKCVLVTNGTASPEILEQLLPYADAMNIDLKGFREDYYRKLGGSLQAVKEFIARSAGDCHVELTTLIVPKENDSEADMEKEAEWIASIDPKIPLHVTRFFPRYHMHDREATNIDHVYYLAKVAGKYLKHVFVGNC